MYNNIQDTLISSRLNDPTDHYRCFNVNIMMLYISAMDHAGKLKFCSYIHLPSINKIYQYRYARLILCSVVEIVIFEHSCYISALGHVMMLTLSSYVLLACINAIYKYGHAWGM